MVAYSHGAYTDADRVVDTQLPGGPVVPEPQGKVLVPFVHPRIGLVLAPRLPHGGDRTHECDRHVYLIGIHRPLGIALPWKRRPQQAATLMQVACIDPDNHGQTG
jgi:hypothetical protein